MLYNIMCFCVCKYSKSIIKSFSNIFLNSDRLFNEYFELIDIEKVQSTCRNRWDECRNQLLVNFFEQPSIENGDYEEKRYFYEYASYSIATIMADYSSDKVIH